LLNLIPPLKKLNKMRKLFYLLISICVILEVSAQNTGDTIIVQTFIHDAWTDGNGNTTISLSAPRDTIGYFPNNPSLTFEKIIMRYNMRCKDNVNTNPGGTSRIGCGAYDYSCQTYVHDSTRIDSVLNFTPDHIISNFSGNTYNYSNNPVYNYYHYLFNYIQYNTVIDSIIQEDSIILGTGNINSDIVINCNELAGKSQFLYLADELNALSLNDTIINGISIYSSGNNPQEVNFLKVKLKLTSDSIMDPSNPHANGFTEVYHSNTILNSGMNRLQFNDPFTWDSVSNIIVEFSFTDSLNTSTPLVLGENIADSMGMYTNDASYIQVYGNEHIDLASSSLALINDEITISFWANGDENILPVNTSLFEALDNTGARTVNLHFPWSNGRIYWDCGNNSSSYDRIDKAASISEYAGAWSHWTFTKNTGTGSMKIYHNGVLWHSGTGKTMPINIDSFKLMSNGAGNNNFWNGKLKELRIFNKEISETTIQNWIHKRLNSNHPNYTNLLAYYPFDEGSGNVANDNSSYALQANFNGNVKWRTNGEEIPTFFASTSFRPNVSFYQGVYIDSTISDTIIHLFIDSLFATPNVVTLRDVFANYGTMLHDSIGIVYIDTLGWEALSYTYSYDANGVTITTTPTNIDSTINISELTYYTRYPMAFQIMSFVTPYGMGLNFGANGETWDFDVTDYSPILKGNKRITMSGGGQWQEDIDIKFLFIVGTPPRDVLEMQQIWRPQYKGYGTIMDDRAFEPRDVLMHPNATAYNLKTTITGHGQEGEFIPQNHTMNIDGGSIDYTWQVWTECAENPIFPQGGTWIYDRAGWCPGQASDIFKSDITSLVNPGQIHNIDYGIVNATGSSNYWVSSQLVSYDEANFTLDAAIIDILSPTNKVNYQKKNPICSKPEIIIQNTGSTAITSLTIEYWINNAASKESFTWTGSLAFLEKTTITLPDPNSLWDNMSISNNSFHVEIITGNGVTDQYIHNNKMSSTFDPTPIYPNTFVLWFTTNNGIIPGTPQISESSWEFFDNDGNSIYASGDLIANTQYRDTLTFNDGCYSLKVTDTDDDGLDFWANNDGGGMARFRELGASWLKVFELDFGRFIHHEFRAENISSTTDIRNKTINIYPNPATNEITVIGNLATSSKIILTDNIGKIVSITNVENNRNTHKIDISNLSKGIYFISLDNHNIIKKVVKQ